MFVEHDSCVLATMIEMLYCDEELRYNYGKMGRKFVVNNFEQHVVWKEIEKLYHNDFLCMMNILITGIHGFVGSNIVRALGSTHALYGLDIIVPKKEGIVKTFSWKDIEPNVFPMEHLPHFDAIIHLAGKAHDMKNHLVTQEYFDINTGLTRKIFDFFLESSAQKFIFF